MSRVIPLVSRAALHARVALARSILAHRPWCPDCRRHINHVAAALDGRSIEQINQRGEESTN